MKSRIAFGLLCLPLSWAIGGCLTAADHASQLHSARERKLTVGVVQKEIHEGMSQADVAAALGSPNIVTKDSGGSETWIYDKIATEASYSNESSGSSGAIGAGGLPSSRSLLLGGIGAGHRRSVGASAMTQRTLTVIIKFNDAGNVADFSYHSSTF